MKVLNMAFIYSTGRYDKENAELAWQRTLTFFHEKLG